MSSYFQTKSFTIPIVPGFDLYWVDDIAVVDLNADGKTDILVGYHAQSNVTLPLRLLGGDGAGGFADITSQVFGAASPNFVMPNQFLLADFNGDQRVDLFVLDSGHDVNPWPGRRDGLYLAQSSGGLKEAPLPNFSDFGHSTTAGDIDGDGDLDIYVGNIHGQADIGPYFLINDGKGGFTADTSRLPAAVASMQGGVYTTSALADFNGDGKVDLFLGAIGLDAAAPAVFWNDGSGRFTSATATPQLATSLTKTYTGVVAADINGDGRMDIIAGLGIDNYARGALQILINLGNGKFADETAQRLVVPPVTAPGDGGFFRPTLYDVNGDGFKDIVLNGFTTTPVLLNDGSGRYIAMPAGFLAPPAVPAGIITYYPYPEGASRPPPAVWVDRFAVGDFNGDGRADLISARGTDYKTTEVYTVFLGTDPGSNQVGGDQADGLMGDADDETLSGLAGDDVIFGGGGRDTLLGGDGADKLVGGADDDVLDGGAGRDTAFYSGPAAAYVITATASGWRVADSRGSGDGVDLVRGVETLMFAGQSVALPDHTLGLAVANILREDPLKGAHAALALSLDGQIAAGVLSSSAAVNELIKVAGSTTSVGVLSYQFFTGKIPSQAGIDYLVSPTGPNGNNLNSAYYQSFNLENRYINFAVNLGKIGEGNAKFTADYGALSLFDATKKAYATIFGVTPSDDKVHALLDPSFTLAGQTLTRAEYFAYYGGDGPSGIGSKAAMVGWLLGEAVKADVGLYAKSNDAFLVDLADGASFAVDLVGVYGKPAYAVF